MGKTGIKLLEHLRVKAISTGLIYTAGLLLLFLLHILVRTLPAEAGINPYLGASLRLWVFSLFTISALIISKVKNEESRGDLFAMVLGLCFAGIVLLGLKNTSYTLNGVSGDQGFQTAQVTKFSSYSGAVDFAYKDLPPFYPPLYFFVLGKTAGLLGIEPYRMLKYGLIATAFILPFLTRKVWFWIQPGVFSFAAIFSLLFFQEWYKPFEWLSLVIFIPWWLHFVDGVGVKKNKRNPLWIILGGLLGAMLFSTYYYWFFIGGISLLIRFLLRATSWADGRDNSKDIRASRVFVLVGTAIFSLPYWGPLVASMWTTGGWVSLQNRYFLAEFNNLRFPFLEFSVTGVIMLAGLVYLLQSFRRSTLSFGLLTLLIAAYAWQVFGYLAFLFQYPLLSFKSRDFVWYVLGLAAVLGVFELMSKVSRSATLRKRWGSVIVGGTVALLLFYGQVIAVNFSDNELLPPALETTFPKELVSNYKAALSNQYLNHVVLGDSGVSELSIYLPVFQFLSWAAVYSHPAGLYNERVDFLQQLSNAENPDWFAAALMNNRYSHIDEIILLPKEDGFIFGYLPENLPERSRTEHIFFPGDLFAPAYFFRKNFGEYVLFTPNYANNPLAKIPDPEDYNLNDPLGEIGEGDDMFEFLTRFGQHTRFPGKVEYWNKLLEVFGS